MPATLPTARAELVAVLMASWRLVDTFENPSGWTDLYYGDFAALARDYHHTLRRLGNGVLINRADGACVRRLVGHKVAAVDGPLFTQAEDDRDERLLAGASGSDSLTAGGGDRIQTLAAGGGDKVQTLAAGGGDKIEVRSEVASPDMVSDEQHRARICAVRGLVHTTRVVWGTGIPSTEAAIPLALDRICELHVKEVTVDVSGQNHSRVCAEWIEGLRQLVDVVYIEPLCHPRQYVEPDHARGLPTASLPARFLLEGINPERLAGSIAVHNTNHPLTPEHAERWAAWNVTAAVARQDLLKAEELEREEEEGEL